MTGFGLWETHATTRRTYHEENIQTPHSSPLPRFEHPTWCEAIVLLTLPPWAHCSRGAKRFPIQAFFLYSNTNIFLLDELFIRFALLVVTPVF